MREALRNSLRIQTDVRRYGILWPFTRQKEGPGEHLPVSVANDFLPFIFQYVKILTFRDAEDIDLLIGGLSETATLGTVFGPTLTCLLAIQFANLRNSDRFWYENDLPPSSLNLPQLQAIRRVTLSGLLCEAKGVSKAQPKAFIREDPYLNARLSCEQLAGMDVTPWRAEVEEEVDEDVEEQTQPPPELAELDIDVIEQAIAKAKDKLNERKRFEYESWVSRK